MPQTPLDNRQSSLSMTQALVMNGLFPSTDGGGGAFMGEIFTFAFNFAPGGTGTANGQVLPITTQNAALFSLIQNFYGGNGTTTFALPNLGGTP